MSRPQICLLPSPAGQLQAHVSTAEETGGPGRRDRGPVSPRSRRLTSDSARSLAAQVWTSRPAPGQTRRRHDPNELQPPCQCERWDDWVSEIDGWLSSCLCGRRKRKRGSADSNHLGERPGGPGLGVCMAIIDASTSLLVGYFPARDIHGRNYHVSDIPADKLTHVVYAFTDISSKQGPG